MATLGHAPSPPSPSDRFLSHTSDSKKPLILRTGFLLKVLPLLGAAVGFTANYVYQFYQARDVQWQNVLEHLNWSDSQNAIRTAYELDGFLDTSHRKEARAMIADTLPAIQDESDFNAIFFDLLHDTTQPDVHQLLSIDRRLTRRLREIYEVAITDEPAVRRPDDTSFRFFLSNTDEFLDASNSKELQLLNEANVRIDELDSVSIGLGELWNGKVVGPRHLRLKDNIVSSQESPDGEELRNVVFYNGDFRNVSFLKALVMSDVHFYGPCKTDAKKLPMSIDSECDDQ